VDAAAQHPECGVIDCPEMAATRGGQQGIVVTLSSAGLRLQVQAWIYTCAKHTEEFKRIALAGGVLG
jgi:uncharacterized protein YidB (DUF937 family)